MTPLLSIIVPVYNVADCMRRGIDSILFQSFRDFEVILVDDGSTDASGRICDEYAALDSRVRVIHKKNGGVSSARNAGLDLASGEWVIFPDPDDEVVPDALLTLVNGISEEVDVVMGGYEEIGLKGNVTRSLKTHPERLLNRTEGLRLLFLPYSSDYFPSNGCVGYVYIRIFRMSVIQDHELRFEEKFTLREASLFVVNFLCVSRGITKDVGRVVYRYIRRESSITVGLSKTFERKYLTSFEANVKMVHLIENTDSMDPELVRCAKEEVMDRYRKIKRKMLKFGSVDEVILRDLRRKCIKELGVPFVAGYLFNWSRKKVAKKFRKS